MSTWVALSPEECLMRRWVTAGGLVIVACLATAEQAPAANKDDINKAITRGVTFLKRQQYDVGDWAAPYGTGVNALAGFTLLECGVPADDPVVEKVADHVRRRSVELTYTYALSLSIMFLDRLGDSADTRLIQSMAVRLIAGQNSAGGWTYDCPKVDPDEVTRLMEDLKQRSELKTKRASPAQSRERKDRPALPKELQKQLQRRQPGRLGDFNSEDNSNTQFAI